MVFRSHLIFLAFPFFLGNSVKSRYLFWRKFHMFKVNTWNLKSLGSQYSNYHLIKADLNMV